MRADEETEQQIDEAIELLKDAGLTHFAIVGKGIGANVQVLELSDETHYDDVAELQGYLEQAKFTLSVQRLSDSDEELEEKSGEDKTTKPTEGENQ